MNNRKFLYSENLLKNEEGGVALILVLWVMVILVAIVGEFAYSMRTEINITRNFKEEEESYQLALAGIERAKLEILLAKNAQYVYLNEDGVLLFKKEKKVEGKEEDEIPERKGELGKGTFSYTLTDENGKLNINTAPPPQIRYIIDNSGVDITDVDTIIDSIIDWIDADNLHMLNGAEDDYYESLEKPYSSKDGPFDSIYELLLVKGVTPEIFYGSMKEEEDEGKNGEDEKKEYEGIAQYFTIWGSGLINVNTAPQRVLEAVFGAARAENIIIQRGTGPILTSMPGAAITSFVFTIISTGTTADGRIKRAVKTTIRREGNKLKTLYWDDNFIL